MRHAFESAGESNSILVTTQLAGRGIDIRLSPESRAKGGMVLIGFCKALEQRLDRQFLGRVGRQGDPYTSFFVCSLDDNLLKMFCGPIVKQLLTAGGFEGNSSIESPMVDRRLDEAQRARKRHRLQTGLGKLYLSDADAIVRKSIRTWFAQSQNEKSNDDAESGFCSNSFLKHILAKCFDHHAIGEMLTPREISTTDAAAIVSFFGLMLDLEPGRLPFSAREIEGCDGADVRSLISNRFTSLASSSMATNKLVRGQIEDEVAEYVQRRDEIQKCEIRKKKLLKAIEAKTEFEEQLRPIISADYAAEDQEQKSETNPVVAALLEVYSISPTSQSSVAIREIHAALEAQNVYLRDHPRAIESVAVRRVRERCEIAGLENLLDVVSEDRRIMLSQSESTNGRFEDGVELADWYLSLAEIAVAGDLVFDEGDEPSISIFTQSNLVACEGDLLGLAQLQIETQCSELHAFGQTVNEKLLRRSPSQIANWTLRSALIEYWDRLGRLKHRTAQTNRNALQHYRHLYDCVLKLWDEIDSKLPFQLLENILNCDAPNDFDSLFWMADHRDDSKCLKQIALPWKTSNDDTEGQKKNAADENIELIDQFVAQNMHLTGRYGIKEVSLRRLLHDFLTESPIYSLRSPNQILDAANDWFRIDCERGVGIRRARRHRVWIKEFLGFLSARNVIGKLPTIQVRCYRTINRLAASLADRNSSLLLMPAVFGSILIFLTSIYGIVVTGIDHTGIIGLVERLTFGTLLQSGSATIPAIGGLIFGVSIAKLVQPSQTYLPNAAGIGKLLVPVTQFGIAIWLTQWFAHESWTSIFNSATWFACMILLSLLVQRMTVITAVFTGISLISGWIAFTAGFVVFPWLFAELGSLSGFWPYCLILIYSCFNLVYYLNFTELNVVSAHIPTAADVNKREFFHTSLLVRGDCGAIPHTYSLFLSTTFFWMFNFWGLISQFSLAVYIVAILVWYWGAISRRFSPELWMVRLNERRQVLQGVANQAEAADLLRRARNKVMFAEMSCHVLIFSFLVVTMSGQVVPGTTFPMAPALFTVGMLFSDHLKQFGAQLFNHMLSRVAVINTEFDLSAVPEPLETKDKWERIVYFFKHRAELVIKILATIFAAIKLLQEIIKWYGSS